MSYGANVIDQFRQAAGYVDRILNARKGLSLQVLAYNMKRMINIFGVKPLMQTIAA